MAKKALDTRNGSLMKFYDYCMAPVVHVPYGAQKETCLSFDLFGIQEQWERRISFLFFVSLYGCLKAFQFASIATVHAIIL